MKPPGVRTVTQPLGAYEVRNPVSKSAFRMGQLVPLYSVVPRFQFVVLNRLSTENCRVDLLGAFEFELSPPYLLYRSAEEVGVGALFTALFCSQNTKMTASMIHVTSLTPGVGTFHVILRSKHQLLTAGM
jgi:hypothetical protein